MMLRISKDQTMTMKHGIQEDHVCQVWVRTLLLRILCKERSSSTCRLWERPMPFIREACLAARLMQQPHTQKSLQSNQASLLDELGSSGQDAQELTATALAVAQARVSGKGASAMGPGQGGNPGADTGPATGQGLAPEAVAGATAAGMELELAAALVAVCQVATNSLEVMPTFVEQVAVGMRGTASSGLPLAVYRHTSHINHSCCPSAAYFFTPEGTVVVRSLRALQLGEELTISYTDLLQTRDERQHSLQQHYCFDCNCPRCSDDSPTPGDWFLDAVAAEDLESAQELHLQVQQVLLEGKAMLLEKGAVVSALCHMEAGLFRLTAQGVHPLHHTCLDLYTCLSSAWRMFARGNKQGCCAAMMHARAALYTLMLANGLKQLLDSGVSGILPHLARQLSDAALALCHCIQAVLQPSAQPPNSTNRGSKRRASDTQSDSSDTSEVLKRRALVAQVGTDSMRSCKSSIVGSQSEPVVMLHGQPGHETQDHATSEESIEPPKQGHAMTEGAPAPPGGEPWQFLVAVAVLDASLLFQSAATQLEEEGQGAGAAGLRVAELAGPDDFQRLAAMSDFALLPVAPAGASAGGNLLEGAVQLAAAKSNLSSGNLASLMSLVCSATACLAGASAALKTAFGSGHKLWELNHFLPLSSGLPFPLAAALMQASSLH